MRVAAGVPGGAVGAVAHLAAPGWACPCCSLSSLCHTGVVRLPVALYLSGRLIPAVSTVGLSSITLPDQTWRASQSRWSPRGSGPEPLGFVWCPVRSSCLPAAFHGAL